MTDFPSQVFSSKQVFAKDSSHTLKSAEKGTGADPSMTVPALNFHEQIADFLFSSSQIHFTNTCHSESLTCTPLQSEGDKALELSKPT